MKTLVTLIMVCVLLPVAGLCSDDAITVQCQIFRIIKSLSGNTAINAKTLSLEFKETDGPTNNLSSSKFLTGFTEGHFKLGEDILEINKDGWFWNKTPLGFSNSNTLTFPENKIRCIIPPVFTTSPGKASTISVVSEQRIEYFEKRDDNLFELRTSDETTGLEISMIIKEGADDSYILSDLIFSLKSVEKREQIPDVTLPVGRPILETRNYCINAIVARSKDCGFILHPGDGQGLLIVRLQVSPARELLTTANQTSKGEEQ